MATLKGDLRVVGHVLGQLLSHDLVGMVSIEDGRKTHAATDSSHWAEHITSDGNRWQAISSSN